LQTKGIETKIHYAKLLDNNRIGTYPNAEKLCNMALSLPIYPYLKTDEVDFICDKIKEFFYV
jgi:dTDP-4-amino-4,6-dideoxygalactose transaminase